MKSYWIDCEHDYGQEDLIFPSIIAAKEWLWKQIVDDGDEALFPKGVDYMIEEGLVWIWEFTLVD